MAHHYRPDIDGLRALAVGAVVVFHAFPGTLPGGFLGVDVFFVISGYLISGLILQGIRAGTFTITGFYLRRAPHSRGVVSNSASPLTPRGWMRNQT